MKISYENAIELSKDANFICVNNNGYGKNYWNKITGELLYLALGVKDSSMLYAPKKTKS